MRRGVTLLCVAALLTVAAGLLLLDRPEPEVDLAASQFETTALPAFELPAKPKPPKPPKARFSRTVWTSTSLAAINPALDQCRGPVAADLGKGEPVYVAEHDYCGGSVWMWKLRAKDAVSLDGEGVEDGLYVVKRLKYFPRKSGATADDLPAGEVILQTCVSASQMVFIALEKYEVIG